MMVWRYGGFCSLALLLGATSIPAAHAERGDGAPTLLVGNKGEDSLSFIDLASGREISREKTGHQPHEIAIAPDGRLAAVVAYGGETIDIFDIAARERIETVSLAPSTRPHGIMWLDDGRIIAATEGTDNITLVSPPTGETQQREIATIATGQKGSHMLVVTPDKSRAFVSNMQSGTVSVLDLVAMTKIADLPGGTEPEGLAITPDGKTVWVADRRGDQLHIFDAISLGKLDTIATGPFPIRVAISPDGETAITSNLGNGTLGLFDVATRQQKATIEISGTADSRQVTILFSSDGSKMYVAETGPDTVAEVDLSSRVVVRRLGAGADGDGLGVAFDGDSDED
ncbi:YncE family protein [Parasphingorhabdus sp.]|uniref:YncE family protein n=1 Tax=Parasphingorhabdus sp. TaxID=2709688 RepID=UPI003002A6A7